MHMRYANSTDGARVNSLNEIPAHAGIERSFEPHIVDTYTVTPQLERLEALQRTLLAHMYRAKSCRTLSVLANRAALEHGHVVGEPCLTYEASGLSE